MFQTNYVGGNGLSAWVRGHWVEDEDGNPVLHVMAVSPGNLEFTIGEDYTEEQVYDVTEADRFAFAA